jgi:hypothetical protein
MQAPPMGFKEQEQTHRETSAFMSGRNQPKSLFQPGESEPEGLFSPRGSKLESLFPPERGTTRLCSQPKCRAHERPEASDVVTTSQPSLRSCGGRRRVTHLEPRKRDSWEEGASTSRGSSGPTVTRHRVVVTVRPITLRPESPMLQSSPKTQLQNRPRRSLHLRPD